MRYTMRLPRTGDIWTQAAADSLVGQTPRLNARNGEGGAVIADYGPARVVAATVVDGGATVEITLETEPGSTPPVNGSL